MAGGRHAAPGVMEAAMGKLHDANGELEGLAGGVPGAPDAAEASGPLGQMLADILEATAQFSAGVAAAADDVSGVKAQYDHDEQYGSDQAAHQQSNLGK